MHSTLGSSAFLKGRFGVGYHMTFVKTPSCSTASLESTVTRHIPDAELTADVGTEVSFLLPKSTTPRFPQLFTELDKGKSALGFESYGVSVTTLEDVSCSALPPRSMVFCKESMHAPFALLRTRTHP